MQQCFILSSLTYLYAREAQLSLIIPQSTNSDTVIVVHCRDIWRILPQHSTKPQTSPSSSINHFLSLTLQLNSSLYSLTSNAATIPTMHSSSHRFIVLLINLGNPLPKSFLPYYAISKFQS